MQPLNFDCLRQVSVSFSDSSKDLFSKVYGWIPVYTLNTCLALDIFLKQPSVLSGGMSCWRWLSAPTVSYFSALGWWTLLSRVTSDWFCWEPLTVLSYTCLNIIPMDAFFCIETGNIKSDIGEHETQNTDRIPVYTWWGNSHVEFWREWYISRKFSRKK